MRETKRLKADSTKNQRVKPWKMPLFSRDKKERSSLDCYIACRSRAVWPDVHTVTRKCRIEFGMGNTHAAGTRRVRVTRISPRTAQQRHTYKSKWETARFGRCEAESGAACEAELRCAIIRLPGVTSGEKNWRGVVCRCTCAAGCKSRDKDTTQCAFSVCVCVCALYTNKPVKCRQIIHIEYT